MQPGRQPTRRLPLPALLADSKVASPVARRLTDHPAPISGHTMTWQSRARGSGVVACALCHQLIPALTFPACFQACSDLQRQLHYESGAQKEVITLICELRLARAEI